MDYPHFKFIFINRTYEGEMPEFNNRWIYKFKGKSILYHVYIEKYKDTHIYAVKFFPKLERNNKLKYHLKTNQNEPRTIFNTIVQIMKDFIERFDKQSIFCYVAAPTPACEGYKNNRKFQIYQRIGYDLLNPEIWKIDYAKNFSAVILYKLSNTLEINQHSPNLSAMIDEVFSKIDWSRKMCPRCDEDCKKWLKHS